MTVIEEVNTVEEGNGNWATRRPGQHDFRVNDWWARNGSQRQDDFRKIAPIPFGSVLIARDDMDEETVRWHLRTMKELGYNAIKQFMTSEIWTNAKLEALALEEGLCPWWYGEAGWEPISDELLRKLDIPLDTPVEEIRVNATFLAYQKEVLAARIGRERMKLNPEQQAGFMGPGSTLKTAKDFGADASLPDWLVPDFINWLKKKYNNDFKVLQANWNFEDRHMKTWEEVAENHGVNRAREYGRVRDLLRFKAEMKTYSVEVIAEESLKRDPYEPQRAGGEMGIFLPFASRGTDMEGIAHALKDVGSFYPSIHLCWHFEEVYFEVARPVYMQAAMVVDWNKGGWTGPWESTGGPQQKSGAKAFLFPWVEDEQPGFTVDAGVMTQLLYSYLAAGCKGVGLWSWNARQAGFEAGEFALLDRNEKVCDRTVRVGEIAKKANLYRDELWESVREPQVGVLVDFDNEAIWAAISQCQRTNMKYRGVEGRIGAARACMDASVTFEHVTAKDIREGLASRYPVIYMPAVMGLSRDLLPILTEYVKAGGRLVMDMPGGCYDETGRMLRTYEGTDYEQLFGCELSDIQYSPNNVVWTIDGHEVEGYTADLLPTTGKVLKRFENNGRPAVIENQLGKGSAVLLGWEGARACYRRGHENWQEQLVNQLLGGSAPFYRCEGGVVAHRLAGPKADHYFLINEGEVKDAILGDLPYEYAEVEDVMTGQPVDLTRPVTVAADDGLWLRCVKA